MWAVQETWVRCLGWEYPLEEGIAAPLLYSCLENPMDRGAWQAAAHRVTKNWTQPSNVALMDDSDALSSAKASNINQQ